MLTEPILVTLLVADALDALNIPYFIGGSLATAVHGVARATMDVDLVADIQAEQIPQLLQVLGEAFYADNQMIENAIRQGMSYNLIHKETMFKVDVFPVKNRAFDRSQFERRTAYALADEPERMAYVASPEDIILAKLERYRLGGEISDRQWQDILNVLKIQGERIDRTYLEHWAEQLMVSNLLQRALEQAT
jgi:hypothetical protein